jgi:hemerythrin-like metal-binding protein
MGIQDLLKWNDDYSCLVTLVDGQHLGILNFINEWYHQITASRANIPDLTHFMDCKLKYLNHFSQTHLRFEEEMMSVLVQDHGFPKEEYRSHLGIHERFIKEFMGNLTDQLQMLTQNMEKGLVDNLAGDALGDVARWWYGHIKSPSQKVPAGPDHSYRLFLLSLPKGAVIKLLNRLLLRNADLTSSTLEC